MRQLPAVVALHFLYRLMRIASWNVNSIKSRLDMVINWLSHGSCDILLMQETKSQDANFPHDAFRSIGWNIAIHGQKSYNGVAIASHLPLTDIKIGLPGDENDEQARYLEALVNDVRVATIYLPNGNPAPGPKFDYKLQWMKRLNAQAKALLDSEAPIVLGGDFNVIPQDGDCYDPLGWEGDALTRQETRQAFRELTYSGYSDALRTLYPNKVLYTYWDYQAGAWQRDNGVRIDHLMLSPEALDRLSDVGVDKGPRGLEKPSDHTPIWCDLTI